MRGGAQHDGLIGNIDSNRFDANTGPLSVQLRRTRRRAHVTQSNAKSSIYKYLLIIMASFL